MASRARSSRGTRCSIRSKDSQFVFERWLPSGISRSLGIKALDPTPNHEAYPCRLPDLPSLPAAQQQFYSSLSAADHRSRSATSCQARWQPGYYMLVSPIDLVLALSGEREPDEDQPLDLADTRVGVTRAASSLHDALSAVVSKQRKSAHRFLGCESEIVIRV
jgi:hypothetical protein